mgnify:CR=1 FL=1
MNRPDFWGFPHWISFIVYVVMSLSGLVMLYLFYQRASLWWKVGRNQVRWDHPWQRLWRVIQHAFIQLRILRQRYPGLMHIMIAWSFFILFLGTPIGVLNAYIFPGFLEGTIFLVFKLIMDLAAIVYLIGAGMAAYRRYIQKPERLTQAPTFNFTLAILTFIVLTGPFIEGTRLAVIKPDYGWWMPFGWVIAQIWIGAGSSEQAALTWHTIFYILHAGAVCAAFITLPAGSLRHVFTTPLNMFFSNLEPAGKLPKVAQTADGKSIYPSRLTDLTWKQLLDGDACTECGRCQDACPAYAAGTPLNPKQVILNIRNATQRDGWLIVKGKEAPALVGEDIKAEVLWSCTTCAACIQECPVWVEHVPTIVQMRRYLVNEGKVDSMLQAALDNLSRYGNSFGQSQRNRPKWTKELETEIKDATKEPVEYLWFVGDYASYNPMLTEITVQTAKVLQHAGIDFGILGRDENNAGNDVRRVGEEGLFEFLVEKNSEALGKCEFKAIITTDPHTYNTLKNEYPAEVLAGRPVLHISEFLDQLITSGKLKFSKKLDYTVTYHDPCYLGRYNGVYDAPRRVLQALGCRLIEMTDHGSRALCCGAGGGRIWMEEGEMKERPSERRVRDAAGLEGVGIMVVTCPKDVTMFQDAVKTTGLEQKLVVKDLLQLVYEAL